MTVDSISKVVHIKRFLSTKNQIILHETGLNYFIIPCDHMKLFLTDVVIFEIGMHIFVHMICIDLNNGYMVRKYLMQGS